MTKVVYIASPDSGDVAADVAYAHACLRHALSIGEAPVLPQLLYAQVLDDQVPNERKAGMAAGQALVQVCDEVVLYVDRGISDGMKRARKRAENLVIPVTERHLPSYASAALAPKLPLTSGRIAPGRNAIRPTSSSTS